MSKGAAIAAAIDDNEFGKRAVHTGGALFFCPGGTGLIGDETRNSDRDPCGL